jgi:DNA-binding FadR family transcriptional regulator
MITASSVNLTSRLTDNIRSMLQTGQYPEGSLFMTEAQLAAKYEVSRTIVREAVSRLRALGILESRQGKGLVVQRPDPLRLLAESLPLLGNSEEDFHDLSKLRYVLEVGSIELAVTNFTDAQIEELHQISEAIAEAIRGGAASTQIDELELQFHTLLLKMTDSPFIVGLHEVLAHFFAAHTSRRQMSSEPDEQTVWQHRELVSAIRDRDTERARFLIRTDLREYLIDERSGENAST